MFMAGCQDDATAITTGFLIALAMAIRALETKYRSDNTCAYTRPIRPAQRAEPWTPYYGRGVKSDMSYYTPSGSVALQWYVPDRQRAVSRGSFRVKDSSSGVIVAEGETPDLYHGG